jgi:hypothetical protein
MLEVSNNSLSILRACPKKYEWHYIHGLTPFKKSHHLSLGSILHQAFDMHYKGFTADDVLNYILVTIDEEIAKASPEESEDLVNVKNTLLGMWIYYPKNLSAFASIQAEKEFRIPIGKDIVFVGKIDGLVEKDGKLWIRELKTTSMSFEQFEKRSLNASQGTAYVWAMQKLAYPVQGIIYDFVKKPLLRKGRNETIDQFGSRIINDYKERPSEYFKRHYSYRSPEAIELFEKDLISSLAELQTRIDLVSWPRNPDQCWNFNSECPFRKICFTKEPDPLTLDLYFEKKPTVNKG